MSRIPFVAAVVGALLIGGAATGGTHASWVDSESLAVTPVTAGKIDFSLASPATIRSVQKGTTGSAIAVLTDDSAGKNLSRRLSTSAAASGSGVTVALKSVDANGNCTGSNLAPFTGSLKGTQQVCVQVSIPSNFTGTATTVTLTTAGQQLGVTNGWSTSHQKQFDIPVGGLTCSGSSQNQVTLSWAGVPAGAGALTLGYSNVSQAGPFTTGQQAVTGTSANSTFSGNETRYYQLSGTGYTSNVVAVTRSNANTFAGCA